ncbi:uncharacterized protein [Rutidosis leptorrhynchoides]|uniref:uncharacterized protein n=1 Tax=Rutidosis leptorrhynchoides TaxID=125765 RepID=UPI003A99C333
MANVGLSLNDSVQDMLMLFNGEWPQEWLSKYPLFHNINLPMIHNGTDQIHWRTNEGVLFTYSTTCVWDSIRPTGNNISWFSVVWFSQCIPRHAFLLWLVMGERLKTHDKMKPWETHSSMSLICPFCKNCPDSHDHLFFDCPFAAGVWARCRSFLDVPLGSHWKDVVRVISPVASRNCVNLVVTKVMFAATIYFVWQERNNRIFKKSHRTEVKLFEDIYATVRLKLLSITFKNSPKVDRVKNRWRL